MPALNFRKEVLVVEDHPLFVQAIGEIVSRIDAAAEVQGVHTLADALAISIAAASRIWCCST